jgi:di/tripeptidase
MKKTLEDMVQENIRICEIPSPSFAEGDRAAYVARRFIEEGVEGVFVDDVFNVHGVVRGKDKDAKAAMLAAHSDTVFPLGTDVTVRREGDRLFAPGVRDNSTGVAALVTLARVMRELSLTPPGDVYLVATACEEGLGDLRGMKAAMDKYRHKVDYVIAVDGSLGGLGHEGIASRRLEVHTSTGGGHSWGDFGKPSAIHALGAMIAEIAQLDVPRTPRTSYNVGVISGGTSINTIAGHAQMLIDMRSVDAEELSRLENKVRDIIKRQALSAGVQAEVRVVGDRPGGSIPLEHPLVQMVLGVMESLDITPQIYPGSTDANVPLSQGIPAVCIGITDGKGAHRMDESLKIQPMIKGMAQLFSVVWEIQTL